MKKIHNYAILSGPNLADEILSGYPAATVVASKSREILELINIVLNSKKLRIYHNDDVTGVLLGGIFKNILAIAGGISDGIGFGLNAKSALLTRGIQEMIRFGVSLGAKKETFFGLSGIGDLIATACSKDSRNWQLGFHIGTHPNENWESTFNQLTVEGMKAVKVIVEHPATARLELPICHQVYEIAFNQKEALAAMNDLLSRDIKAEF